MKPTYRGNQRERGGGSEGYFPSYPPSSATGSGGHDSNWTVETSATPFEDYDDLSSSSHELDRDTNTNLGIASKRTRWTSPGPERKEEAVLRTWPSQENKSGGEFPSSFWEISSGSTSSASSSPSSESGNYTTISDSESSSSSSSSNSSNSSSNNKWRKRNKNSRRIFPPDLKDGKEEKEEEKTEKRKTNERRTPRSSSSSSSDLSYFASNKHCGPHRREVQKRVRRGQATKQIEDRKRRKEAAAATTTTASSPKEDNTDHSRSSPPLADIGREEEPPLLKGKGERSFRRRTKKTELRNKKSAEAAGFVPIVRVEGSKGSVGGGEKRARSPHDPAWLS